jgi:hypothetical protein
MKYKYIDPMAEENSYDNMDFLQSVLDKEQSYWTKGSGDSAVEVKKGESLIFFKVQAQFGFIHYPTYTVPVIRRNEKVSHVEYYIGGEKIKYPSNGLCDSQIASEVLKYYIQSGGELKPDFQWHDLPE